MVNRSNINAAKELVALYRSITEEQFQIRHDDLGNVHHRYTLTHITGFGETNNCTLCKTSDGCEECVYSVALQTHKRYPCTAYHNRDTYDAIKYAKTTSELIAAIRNRADHLEKRIKKVESSNDINEAK